MDKIDERLKYVEGLYQCSELIKSCLELRQSSQMTNGLVDRNLCDAMIAHSANTMKYLISALTTISGTKV